MLSSRNFSYKIMGTSERLFLVISFIITLYSVSNMTKRKIKIEQRIQRLQELI